MKKQYTTPELVVFGRIDQLTLGVSGTLPDVDINLVNINDDCIEEELPGGSKTIACIVAGAS